MRARNAIAAAIAVSLLAPTALAEPASPPAKANAADPSDAKARAQVFFKNGISAYRHHRYKDAIDAFLKAHGIYPSPTLAFNTARAYEKLHDSAGALRFYRAYLRQAPDASDKAMVDKRIAKLEARLHKKGVQQLTVMSTPGGATVIIDGKPVGVTPWTGEIYPGRHHLRLSLDGYQDDQRDFELPDLQAIDVSTTLDPAPPPAPPPVVLPPETPKKAPPPAREPSHRGVGLPTWIAFGAGAATLAGAAVFEGLRRSSQSSVQTEPTQVARASAYDQMKSRQTAARVLAGVGGAFLVIGGVLLYVDLSHESGSEKSAHLALDCGPGSCAAELGGRW